MNNIKALILALLLGACSQMDVADYECGTGGRVPSQANHCVFQTAAEIKAPYKELGPISEWKLGKFQRLDASDAIAALQTQTRFLGGNAMLLPTTKTIYSGVISRGYEFEGTALLVGPNDAGAAGSVAH